MGLTERLFGDRIQDAVERRLEERIPEIRDELARTTAAEATSPEASSWAFEHLSGRQYATGSSELPQPYIDATLRDSNWLYESHGLAYMIVSRIVSLIFEGGLQYTVEFDDGVPDDAQAAIRKRLDGFFYGEDSDLQDRAQEFVLEALLNGEHGWRLRVDPDSGEVQIGDVRRYDVEDMDLDRFDSRKLMRIRLRKDLGEECDEMTEEERTLRVVRIEHDATSNAYQHLAGDVLYYRLDTRASKRRGSPVLQRVTDELRALKRFQVMSTDRIIQRLATFVSVTLKGKSLPEVQAYADSQPKSIPSGTIWYGNDQVERRFESGTLEGYEITAIIKTLITTVAGSFGMPISWFGFGDGTNKATADSQQEPAAQDSRRIKRGMFELFEKLLYFVVDQAIIHRVVSTAPQQKIAVTDSDGRSVQKLLRDCVTITVSPIPMTKQMPDGAALEATAAAIEIISKDDMRGSETGQKLLSPENAIALMNHALARDGVGIEVVQQEDVPVQPAVGGGL